MPINFLPSIKNYKNSSKLMLISSSIIAAAILIVLVGSGVSFNNDDDDNFFGSFNIKNNNRVYAQQQQSSTGPSTSSSSLNKITIALSSAQFMPLTNLVYNQLKVIVQYKTNDASLINTKANGLLRVSSLNGTVIKTSSFPNGFLLNQKTGSIQFATSFTDKSLQNVKADVVLTDLIKINPISNVVTTNVSLNNTVK
ncbi:MAG: hypothetical protein ACTHKF_00215 [Candidatus Nitrosocosmicus sp.]